MLNKVQQQRFLGAIAAVVASHGFSARAVINTKHVDTPQKPTQLEQVRLSQRHQDDAGIYGNPNSAEEWDADTDNQESNNGRDTNVDTNENSKNERQWGVHCLGQKIGNFDNWFFGFGQEGRLKATIEKQNNRSRNPNLSEQERETSANAAKNAARQLEKLLEEKAEHEKKYPECYE
jgi:hypothetical protein